MRRHEKEITSQGVLEQILWQGQICQLAIPDQPVPYLVPMNYGYGNGILYFHCADRGRKIDLLRQQPLVSFCIVVDPGVVAAEQACHWGARFRSVIGYGRVEFVENEADKITALRLLMAQYSDEEFTFPQEQVAATTIFRLVIEKMAGKQSRI